jgi:hypothetical protein
LRFGRNPGVSAAAYFVLVLFGLGRIDCARSFLEQAFGRALRSTATIVYGQFLKSIFEALAGSPERAAPHTKATITIGREHGMPVWVAVGTFYEGWVLSYADPEHGIPELRRGLLLCHEVGVLNWLAQMVVMQAAAEADVGYIEDGLTMINDFLAETQPIKQRWRDADLHRLRGALSDVARRPSPRLLRRRSKARLQSPAANRQKHSNCAPPPRSPDSGAIRASGGRPTTYLHPSMAGSPKVSTRSISGRRKLYSRS